MTSKAALLSISLIILSGLTCLVSSQWSVTTVVSEPELGQWFTIQCQVSQGEGSPVLLSIRKAVGQNAPTKLVNYLFRDGTVAYPSQTNRLSFDKTNFMLNVTNAVCEDENDGGRVSYICVLSYTDTLLNIANVSSRQELTIRARPEPPTILRTTPPGLLDDGHVVEGERVSVTCQATVGRGDKGGIVWKIFRGTNRTDVPSTDPTVSSVSRPGIPSCTAVVESTLTIDQVTRKDQDLRIVCLVVNEDFNPIAPNTCADTSLHLCQQTPSNRIHYPVTQVVIDGDSTPTEGETTTLTCFADAVPTPSYVWVKNVEGNRTLASVMDGTSSKLSLVNLTIDSDSGDYNCTASNNVSGISYSATNSFRLTIVPKPTDPPTTPTVPTEETPGGAVTSGDSDDEKVIIGVCVGLAVVLLIVIIVIGVVCYRRRNPKKEIEEPSEKPYNNRQNLSFQNPQPDLVADEKKFHNPSLNNSFDQKNEDGLMYADLTYDNRPRSRKPMALGDTMSDYSDVQMPEV